MDLDDDDVLAEQTDQDPEDPDDPTVLPLSFYTTSATPLTQPFLTPTKPIIISSAHAAPANTSQTTPGAVVQNNQIWQAVRDSVMDVCGDVGWGKVASSLQGSSAPPLRLPLLSSRTAKYQLLAVPTVKYYSPTTSLCIIRVAREHVRTAWTGLTFVNTIGGQPVVPRVVAVSGKLPTPRTGSHCSSWSCLMRSLVVSGTIKKLHFAAIRYSKEITALYLAHTLRTIGTPHTPFLATPTL